MSELDDHEDDGAQIAAEAAAEAFRLERGDVQPSHTLARTLEEYQEQESLRIALEASTNRNPTQNVNTVTDDSAEQSFVNDFGLLDLADDDEEEDSDDADDTISVSTSDTEVNSLAKAPESLDQPVREVRGVEKLVDHLFMNILLFLDEETLQRTMRVNKFWKHVVLSEPLWKSICDATFVPPAYRRIRVLTTGKPRKYKTWLATAMRRPRVRIGGMYVLKQFYIRNPGPKTMWSVSHEPFHQVKHYRYLWFLPEGRVLYTINPKAPHKVERDMLNWILADRSRASASDPLLHGGDLFHPASLQEAAMHSRYPGSVEEPVRSRNDLFLGSYQVRDGEVTVVVSLSRHTSKFKLNISSTSSKAVHDKLTMTVLQSVYHANSAGVQTYDLEDSDEIWDFFYRSSSTKHPVA